MIGTVFLFIMWPSFNAVTGANQHRAVINTIISITGSMFASCSAALLLDGKLNMDAVLNSSLAGGVAIGAFVDVILHPGISLLTGFLVGIISTFGFLRLNEFMQKRFGLYDTCGVQYLHGIPGVCSGLISCMYAASYQNKDYGA